MKHAEHYEVNGAKVSRADAEILVYRWTHRDFKGNLEGSRWVMALRHGASCLVPLAALTDAEIMDRLPRSLAREADKRAAKVRAKEPS